MPNLLDELINRVEEPSLRSAISVEVDKLRSTKSFGLVYEKHLPESVRVRNATPRQGSSVHIRSFASDDTYVVVEVKGRSAILRGEDGEERKHPIRDLEVVRNFGEPIYPGFKRISRIVKDAGKPSHVLINAENYHAIEALIYTVPESVDVRCQQSHQFPGPCRQAGTH